MDTQTRRRLARLCLSVLLLLSPVAVLAHGGVDDETPVAIASDPTLVARAVSNAALELVLKYQSTASPARIQVYLTDFATNSPVSGARITLRTTTPIAVSTSVTEVQPGIYQASFAYPKPGKYTLVATISGPVAGEFAMSQLPFGLSPTGERSAEKPRTSGRPIGLFVALGLAVVALALWMMRRRSRSGVRRAQAAALMLIGALVFDNAPALSAGAAGPRYVAKESQLLLAIRTFPLRLVQLRSQLSAVGHVVPGTGAWTTIAAPQSGRYDGRTLSVGDRVARGQILGYLQVIDRLAVRAPISGLIAEIEATPGQWVQAGQPLMRVLDPNHLRVEVPLFGENLTRGLSAKSATVRLSAVPGRAFPARIRGLAPTATSQSNGEGSSETGTATASPIPPLILDVTNTGGFLRPGMLVETSLEMSTSEAVLAVPQSALVYQETGPGVFVHTAPEIFEFRAVSLGERYVDRIGVTGELKPGDRIVSQGAYSLVAAPPATSAAPPAPAAAGGTAR